MRVKDGDIIEFIAISWDEPQWEFDFPCVILKPVIEYSPNGDYPDYMIEEMAISLMCGDEIQDEDVSEEFTWRQWKITKLKQVAKDRLAGKDTWKTKIREVIKQKIRFYASTLADGELEFEILETIRA